MRILSGCVWLTLALAGCAMAQQPAAMAKPTPSNQPDQTASQTKMKDQLTANVTAEWEAFKKKDKKAYDNLLADDFVGVEDDNQGQRRKAAAVAEIERSVVNDYKLFALSVTPLDPNSALVTYELTLLFPPKATVKFKRVMVGEVWIRHNGQWKQRYYQETHVR